MGKKLILTREVKASHKGSNDGKKYKYYIDAWFAGVAMKEELEKSGSKSLWLYSNRPSREVVLQEGAKEDSFMFDKGYKIVGVFKYERIG